MTGHDEVTNLKAALLRGEWRRLLDPLLLALLVSDPGPWWDEARFLCAFGLGHERQMADARATYREGRAGNEVERKTRILRAILSNPASQLPGCPTAQMLDALAIIERRVP